MANIDLSGYNLSELKGLHHEIDLEIKSRQHQDMQKAREQILAIAQEAGVSLGELLDADRKKPKGRNEQKIQARYQNPANNRQTWTGRGRQPKWIAEGIANGKTLDDFLI